MTQSREFIVFLKVQLIQKPFCILARLYADDDVKWKQLLGR